MLVWFVSISGDQRPEFSLTTQEVMVPVGGGGKMGKETVIITKGGMEP